MKQCGAGKKCSPSPRPKIKCLIHTSPPPGRLTCLCPLTFLNTKNALGPKNLRTTDLEQLTKNNPKLNNKNLQLGQPNARVVTLCTERNNRDTKSVSNEGTQYMQARNKRLFSNIGYHIIIAKFRCSSAARPVLKVLG